MKTRKVPYKGDGLIVELLRLITYAGLAASFFWLMSINSFAILTVSRTMAASVLTYCVMTFAMHSVYGGFVIGRKKSRPIITSMWLGAVCTDLVTYLMLQIMNVNTHNHQNFQFFNQDFPYLIAVMILQALLLCVTVRLGNEVFFRIHPPRNCLIILGNIEEREAIEKKVGRFRLQWHVTDVALWTDRYLEKRIEQVEVVFIADVPDDRRMALMKICYDLHRDVLCKAQLQEIMLANANQVIVDDAPFLEMEYHKTHRLQMVVKRAVDICISVTVLVGLSPLMLLTAIAIKLDDGGPVLFRQMRATVNGREFNIYKFRTMKVAASRAAHYVSTGKGDPRITRIGHFLRRSRIDEIPQFWNILKGEMTMVGPRPEMLDNVAKYKMQLPSFVYREKMKAGLTGYAQIEGRYNTTPEDKLMLDLMYIESFSLWKDLKLLLRTLTVFFKKDSTEGFADEQAEGSSRKTALVIMAAGLDSRYNGNKEIDHVGPNGEALMEYAVHDAIEAGFNKIIFVIRQSMSETFRELIGDKIAQMTEVHYVFQEFDSLPGGFVPPKGRIKPYGTVHALLSAKDVINEPFAVINAGDYYGREAFETMINSLRTMTGRDRVASTVAYSLKNTLSENGTVNRGICERKANGTLARVTETYQIREMPDGTIRDLASTVNGRILDPDALVSMNLWGFTPWIFKAGAEKLADWLQDPNTNPAKGEYVLSAMIDDLIRDQNLPVSVLYSRSAWFGITYPADKESVSIQLARMHERGQYPERL